MTAAKPGPLLADALVAELGAAMGALVGGDGLTTAADGRVAPGWTVSVTVGEPAPGVVTFAIGADDCARLVQRVTGSETADDAGIADLLRDVVGRAVGALRDKPPGKGVLFCVETPAPSGAMPDGEPRVFSVGLAPDLAPRIAAWSRFGRQAETGPAVPGAAPSDHASACRPAREAQASASGVPANLDVILDIDLPLSVRFGQTDLTLDALTRLGPGSVIDLGRSPDEPVEVLVNGRLVARGEVVVVAGNYGVRIVEVVSAADRVRSLSA